MSQIVELGTRAGSSAEKVRRDECFEPISQGDTSGAQE